MSNLLNMSDSVNFSFRTGAIPTFLYDNVLYDFSPEGLLAFFSAEDALGFSIPTEEPTVGGIVWNDNGTLKVSSSLISASVRTTAPFSSSNAFMGAQVTTNSAFYVRCGDRAVRAVQGIRKVYSGVAISTSVTLAAYINDARQEQGIGIAQTIRGNTITNPTGVGIDQSSGTVTVDTFSDAKNGVTFRSGDRTMSCITKLDNSVTPPVMVSRTYAEMVADGGLITSSTVNSVTVDDTICTLPSGYVIITDEGPDIGADEAYFWSLELKIPVVTISSITASDGSFVVNTANTQGVMAGDVGTILNATGNTTVNGTWQVASVVANTSITFTASTATTGAVTGTPLLRFQYPTHVYEHHVTSNNLGDYQKLQAATQDIMGTGNWTALGAGSQADGSFGPGFCAILGTDPLGADNVVIEGDSIAHGIRDGIINDPSSAILGNDVGAHGFASRALYANLIPSIKMATPSMSAATALTDFDDSFRRWLCNFADVCWTNDGHNTAFSHATYAPFKANMQNHWNTRRAALRGTGRVVTTTQTPVTSQISADHWKSGRNGTWQTNGGGSAMFVYPGGYIYNNYHAELLNSTLVTSTVGGVDGFVNVAQFLSDAAGPAAIDGYWAVDGTDYKYTTDGTHPSKDGHIAIAAACTRPVLVTAKILRS